MARHDFFGHPAGLSTLFFTEMWERFSYYGMRALLILFMVAPVASGGLGFDTGTAGAVYGLYTSMVYMATLPGGWVADHLLGQRRSVLWGGILIMLGHFCLAAPWISSFYAGLFVIVVGTGLLKGNISVLVGQLYAPDDARRDAGFSIYYMGVNIGGFIAPIACGYLGQAVSWHAGFAAAGVGMLLGLVQYVRGQHRLGDAGLEPAPGRTPEALATLRRRALGVVAVVVAALVAVVAASARGLVQLSPTVVADIAGYTLLIVTVLFFAWLFFGATWTRQERARLALVGILFLGAALFWSEFEQAGSTLNLFADRDTATTIFGWHYPSSFLQSAQPIFIIVLAPVFAWLWVALGRRNPSTPVKFALGLIGVGAGFAVLVAASSIAATGIKVSPLWLVVTYLLHTLGELSLSPVGLSAMTRLAPARVAGLMMGVWFLAASVGNFIGGRLASFYGTIPLPQLFGAVAVVGIAAGVVLLLAARPIERMLDASVAE